MQEKGGSRQPVGDPMPRRRHPSVAEEGLSAWQLSWYTCNIIIIVMMTLMMNNNKDDYCNDDNNKK